MKQRIFGLDLLRAFAIFSIMVAHGTSLLPTDLRFINQVLGWNGVALFFVLSGYLIGSIIIKANENQDFKLKEFYIRRWFRTFPNYFLILTVLIFFASKEIVKIGPYLTFIQNFNWIHPNFFPEAWSLCVEEWFYLLFPIVLLSIKISLKISPKKALLITIISFVLFGTFYRIYKAQITDYETILQWSNVFRKQVLTRLDCIVFGVLGAYLSHYNHQAWKHSKRLKCTIGLVLLIFFQFNEYFRWIPITSTIYSVWYFLLQSIGWLLVFPIVEELPLPPKILHRIVTQTSVLSYAMYLLNLSIVLKIIIPWTKLKTNNLLGGVGDFMIFYAVTMALSWLLYKFYENPLTRLRDRFSKKRLFTNAD